EKTLESATYPEITFRSARIEKQPGGIWKVEGSLTLHGITKPVTASVTHEQEFYTGHATIKQTDFGIKPISAGAGTVKVKNELAIEFRIVAGG
ncbi:MAG: YceI family protein, partial [Bryobacteraceae bacterium]